MKSNYNECIRINIVARYHLEQTMFLTVNELKKAIFIHRVIGKKQLIYMMLERSFNCSLSPFLCLCILLIGFRFLHVSHIVARIQNERVK